MIESPQSFVSRSECDKASFQNGFRLEHGESEGWRRYGSTTAQGSIWLARDDEAGWLLATDHAGAIAELGIESFDADGPGLCRFRFASLGELYEALPRLYALAVSLPDAPLEEFLRLTSDLPKKTEAERLMVQRVGQSLFREKLMKYWRGRCCLSGISDSCLLRASHIKPWKDCETDHERLDVHNGLLLSSLWDSAFDGGLVTFDDDGNPEFSSNLSLEASEALVWRTPLKLTDEHRKFLEWHRREIFRGNQ